MTLKTLLLFTAFVALSACVSSDGRGGRLLTIPLPHDPARDLLLDLFNPGKKPPVLYPYYEGQQPEGSPANQTKKTRDKPGKVVPK